jgi:2-oxoglutarate ferredoxin oxidoreductase subunit beta
VARTADVFNRHLREILLAAAAHQGSAFVQILQNCVIFNKGAFASLTDRGKRDENTLYLQHGEPLVFGRNKDMGLQLTRWQPEDRKIGPEGAPADATLMHDETDESLAYLLSRLEFPMPMGIFHRKGGLTPLDRGVHFQGWAAREQEGAGDLMRLIHSGDIWEVEG